MDLVLIIAAVALVAAAALVWALIEARAFTVRHVTVPVLSPGSTPIRILHLSDIHATPRQSKKLRWVSSLGDLDVDMVINTGDNLGHVDAVGPLAQALAPLLGVTGVFVYGSNDYYAPHAKSPLSYFRGPSRVRREPVLLPVDDLTAALTESGWHNLNNERASVQIKGVKVSLVGMDDPHIDGDRLPAGSPAGDLHIGVVHAPYARALGKLRHDGADIIFAGHTHGGQVCIPWWGALVANCDLALRKARGLHGWPGARPDQPAGEDSTWLHVSAGIGTSPFAPIRFACRPEATVVELIVRS